MGSALSRARKPVPPRSTIRPVGEILPSARPPPPDATPRASGSKTAAIESDGYDPTLLHNLSQLGQVAVPRPPHLFRSDNRMLDILAQRKATEEAAELSSRNRPSAQSLSNLFDERKGAKSRQNIMQLAEDYGIDVEILDELGKHVTSPSVSSVRTLKEDLEETKLARWVDPPKELMGP